MGSTLTKHITEMHFRELNPNFNFATSKDLFFERIKKQSGYFSMWLWNSSFNSMGEMLTKLNIYVFWALKININLIFISQ